MFVSPKIAIENKWITHPECNDYQDFVDRDFISPNAIDFTVDRIFNITSNPFIISEKTKTMRGGGELDVVQYEDESYWKLNKGVYDGMSNFYVELPEGIACEFIIRSTFNRNGVFITSGLYDSGFKGNLGFAIHNRGGEMYVSPGTRIAQIKFLKSDKAGVLYKGGYNTDNGNHWSEQK